MFPQVAAAQQSGAISPRQARLIVHAVDMPPEAVQAEQGVQVEAELVEHAKALGPAQLGKLARRVPTTWTRTAPSPTSSTAPNTAT